MRHDGKRLNSPNNIAVKSDGTLWFPDPPFGLTQPNQGCGGRQEQPGSFVFRFDPNSGDIEPVVTKMTRPNGIVFNPEKVSYMFQTLLPMKILNCITIFEFMTS